MNIKFLITNKKRAGTTILELLLYMAVLSFFLTALVLFAWNIIQGGAKSGNESRAYADARYVSERIKYEIRNATSVNTASSNFGANLATSAGSKLSLDVSSPNNPTLIDVSDGRARIKLGAANEVELNSNLTTITDLTFTNLSSVDNKTKNIAFTLTVISNIPSRGNIKETTTIRSTAELRSN